MKTMPTWGLLILGIILLALGFNYPLAWPLVFVGLIPFWYALDQTKIAGWKVFLGSALAGIIYNGWAVWWHWDVLPLDWAGINNNAAGYILVGLIWLATTVLFGLGIGLAGYSFFKLKTGGRRDVFVAPAVWILGDYFRAFGLSILWLGPGSLVGPHWTAGFAGYALAHQPQLLSLAGLGGVYLLTFVAVWISFSLYRLITTKQKFYLATLLIPFALATGWYYLQPTTTSSKTLQLAIFKSESPSFFYTTQEAMVASLHQYQAELATIKTSGHDPDVIIFPEDERIFRKLVLAKDQNYFKNTWGDRERLIIDSSRVDDPISNQIKSKFFYYNTATGQTTESEKFMLVPHGEYLPYVTQILGNLISREAISGFQDSRGYVKGSELTPGQYQGVGIGALACSEIMSGPLYSELTNRGANILVNAASHSLFHGSHLLYNQTVSMAKVRAVENNRYFVEASNYVPSYAVSNHGDLIAESTWDGESILYADVPAVTNNSPYSRLGDWILVVSVIIVIVSIKKMPPKRSKT